jgi:hypothetical protein
MCGISELDSIIAAFLLLKESRGVSDYGTCC